MAIYKEVLVTDDPGDIPEMIVTEEDNDSNHLAYLCHYLGIPYKRNPYNHAYCDGAYCELLEEYTFINRQIIFLDHLRK